MDDQFAAVILAAGQGTRMKSTRAKVLHEVLGLPMYAHVVRAALEASIARVVLVVGHERAALEEDAQKRFGERVQCALQERQLGTGDAVRAGLGVLSDFSGWVLVLCGDTPLVHATLLRALMQRATESQGPLAMLTSELSDPTGYGRIVRDAGGQILRVVEQRDASAEQRAIREVNPSVYAVRADFLRSALARLTTNNAQGELYMTDVIEQAATAGGVSSLAWPSADTQGVNDRAQLAQCEAMLRLRRAGELARGGVTIRDPATAYIELDVQLAPDAIIEPNVHLRGKTTVGAGAHIETGCVLTDVQVASGAHLKPYTVATNSSIGSKAETGPFAHLRSESVMEAHSKVGNFVEMKKTRLGEHSKASHLSYLGDGDIGRDVNIGAGTIFCNYDGFNKHTTILEDDVFIGSDSQLVAPVRVGKGAYVGTGTTLTLDVPDGALALSRIKQTNKEGYARRLKARFEALKREKQK